MAAPLGRAQRLAGLAALLALVAALAAVPHVAAHDESEAPRLRSDVVAAWHEPDVVQPGSQWHGFLRFAPGHNVTAAYYQVCRVGDACFAPPTRADRLDNDTFAFDTDDYRANGIPVHYEAGWRIGVKWILNETKDGGTASMAFPVGIPLEDEACRGDAALACAESHYLAFDMPPAPHDKGAGQVGAVVTAALVAVVAALRRRRP